MSRIRIARWIGPVVVAAAGVAMLCWTWRTWPDPITDFGKEVYLAWQLSLGQHLYSDVAYHLGPFSPYFNALVFKIAGASLSAIWIANFCVLAAIAALMYRLVRRVAGDLAATASGVTFMALFAFTHFTQIVDYNFMAPYDHAHTHGLLLGLLALTAAEIYSRTYRSIALAAAGFFLGVTFLTRAELFVAAVAGVGVMLVLAERRNPRRHLRSWIAFAGAALAPVVLAFLLLWIILSASGAFRGVLGSWPIVFDRSVSGNPFYRRSMGTDDIPASLLRIARWSLWWAVIFVPPALAGRFSRHRLILGALAACWAIAAAYVIGTNQDFSEAFTPLPLALAAALFLVRRNPIALGAVVWALALLAKILLFSRIVHYGFALAMPATLLVVALGIGFGSLPVRAAVLAALGMVIFGYLFSDYPPSEINLMKQQTYSVGNGADRFWADLRGGMLQQVAERLQQHSTQGQTLVVMPEGAMLNFLTRMPNPTPYWSFNPPYAFFSQGQGDAAGQARILQFLEAHPPDWIGLVAEDLSDFGTPFFGRDYGGDLYAFSQHGYVPDFTVGDPPFTGRGFGIILLRRVGYNGSNAIPAR